MNAFIVFINNDYQKKVFGDSISEALKDIDYPLDLIYRVEVIPIGKIKPNEWCSDSVGFIE